MFKKLYEFFILTLTRLSPSLSSRVLYLRAMKRPLRLRDPQLFSEKLMKLKLEQYNQSPTVWKCVDKLSVREYCRGKGVKAENLPTLLGVYSTADDIKFDVLPERFVLKCTHGAGFNIICKSKADLDECAVVSKLNCWLSTPFGLASAETHYGKIAPSVICEQFIEGEGGSPPSDFKVYCFSGIPRYVMVCTDRVGQLSKVNLFDLNWRDTGYIKSTFSSEKQVKQPASLLKMLEIAAEVSREFPFVRIDFFEDGGVPILGEMTFTPHACINNNMTEEGQVKLGRLIDLSYGEIQQSEVHRKWNGHRTNPAH